MDDFLNFFDSMNFDNDDSDIRDNELHEENLANSLVDVFINLLDKKLATFNDIHKEMFQYINTLFDKLKFRT